MTRFSGTSRCILACLALAVLAGGCGERGPARFPIQGEVSWEGQPVADGIIAFYPAAGTTGPVAGGSIRDGRYALTNRTGPVAGRHMVEIRAMRPRARPFAASNAPSDFGDDEQYIPDKYNAATTLEAAIDPTTKTLDFHLTK